MAEVLTLDNAAHANNRARLHADGCAMLRAFNGRRGFMAIRENVAEEVAELEANGYPVKRCKCLPTVHP